jgi:hypothetical protein
LMCLCKQPCAVLTSCVPLLFARHSNTHTHTHTHTCTKTHPHHPTHVRLPRLPGIPASAKRSTRTRSLSSSSRRWWTCGSLIFPIRLVCFCHLFPLLCLECVVASLSPSSLCLSLTTPARSCVCLSLHITASHHTIVARKGVNHAFSIRGDADRWLFAAANAADKITWLSALHRTRRSSQGDDDDQAVRVCVCVCVCAYVRMCAGACVCVCVCVFRMSLFLFVRLICHLDAWMRFLS